MSGRRLSRRADRVWKRLASWYGSRLAEQYGSEPPEDWCNVIDRIDDERLDTALSSLRHASPVHPPTLGQLEAAIPRRDASNGISKPQQLCELMLAKHGRDLCSHQLARPWNYFGPMREFQLPKIMPPEFVTHPDPRGVQVPACEACDKPTVRVLLDEAVSEGVAA